MKSPHATKLVGLALCGAAVALTVLSPPIAAQQAGGKNAPAARDPFSGGAPSEAEKAEKEQQDAIKREVAGRLGYETTNVPPEMYKYVTLDYKRQSTAEQRIRAALDDETTLEFVDTPLSDVVQYLKELHHIEIQLDPRALDAEGIGNDTPITRNLSDITLRDALRLTLDDLDLDFIIRDEVLLITSRKAADRWLETHVYDVRHLKHFTARELADMVRETVRPQSWEPADSSTASTSGPDDAKRPSRGTIVPLGGALVVTQSQRGQAAVVELLHQLARFDENPLYK